MKDDIQLAKWLNDEMVGKDLQDFTASKEFATYNRIKKYSGQLTAPDFNMEALYESVSASRNRERKVRTLISPWVSRIAAVLVIALCITYYFYTTNTTTQMAANGNRTEFLLPDNSAVVLNAGSSAEYRSWNWKNNRNVVLEGEAFFKVAKGEKFDVTTTLGKVTVVGTQFNVKARNNRLDVTCFEGKVKVTYNKKELMLLPGKSVSFDSGKQIAVPAATVQQPGWLAFEVNYQEEKLENIVAELQRQYNVTIDIKVASPKRYTGPIPMNNLSEAIQLLEAIYQFKSSKSGNKIILSSE